MTTEKIPHRRLLLVLTAAWLVLNFNVLVRGKVLPWDAIYQFYPTVYFNAHSLRTGLAPWWNPYIYGGFAQLGDPQGMLFSPLLMAWMLIPPDPGGVWFSWGVLLHVLMGGAAMLGVLRRHGANALGTLLGAIVYMAGGVAASRLEHVPIVIAYAYVPVVLLALRRVLELPGIARGGLLGLAAGAMVTQLTQVTYLFVLVLLGYAAVAVGTAWRVLGGRERKRVALSLGAAVAIALLIGLPQLLFSWATMQLSNRASMALALADGGSLDPRAFLFFLNPNAYGGFTDFTHAVIDPVQSFLYIGVVPTLVLTGLVRAWKTPRRRRGIVCFAVLAGLAMVYMVGTRTPVYAWLYAWLPGLTHFRRPSDAAYVLNFALAFLVAAGATQVNLRSRREMAWLAALALLWLAVLGIASRFAPHGAPGIAVIVGAVVLWQVFRPGGEWRVVLLLVVLLVADYRSYNFNGRFNASYNDARHYQRDAAARYLVENLGAHERIAVEHTSAAWDNMGMVSGIRSTQGYNPLRDALYEAWYRPRENINVTSDAAPYNAPPDARLDDLLGVRYLAIGHGDAPATYAPPPDYIKVGSFPYVDLWRNDGAYARFLQPAEVHWMKVGESPAIEAFNQTDFAQSVWLTPRDDEDRAVARAGADTCGGRLDAEVTGATYSRVDVAVHSAQGGWLVAGDVDHPGWVAALDGAPLPIHRANGMFRAVCVPSGDHRLTFAFSPMHLLQHAWKHRRDTRAPGS
ncbi:YfhO family protein [Luteibacter aegosomatissinici]|uniref:YfhO family protein n=1 Tax=Luteibacter aegosomatissinici TaxID=2911539 RepID=UPI001FFB6984|nr:YfhO family protein [Luteibacter aegosomatissinici]UPG94239.1 YfhO family protein [Luteibacter aegosomatissinici]